MSNRIEAAFEENIETHLTTHGWRAAPPSSYDRDLGLFPDEVISFVQESQPKAWKQLVTRHGGESTARQRLVKVVADAIDHRGTISVLRGTVKDSGVALRMCWFKPANTLAPELLERYKANRCGVVRQLHHSESRPADSLDLVLVVNGVPVATAELKNPLTGQGLEQAMHQYRTDRNPHDRIFAKRTLVHFAVDPHQVAMTTKLDGEATRFLPFNQGSAGPGAPGAAGNPPSDGYRSAYLWKQVLDRDAWLDLLGTFIHTEGKQVLFPRFHQWHAVRSIVAATYADGAGVDRLIQHSAGSGKSNTIAWTAHSLSHLHDAGDQPIFDKVIVITDRRVLDRQLQDTVAGLDHTPGTIVRIDQKSDQLKNALAGHGARIIITTLQKFPVVAQLAAEEAAKGEATGVAGRRFAVIVDEAHSSTTGDSMKKLKKVLSSGDDALAEAEAVEAETEAGETPDDALLESARNRGKQSNLSYFAFTATPKPKTLDTFGQTNPNGLKVPFHTYSMRQAIDEGFILDVLANYTTYSTYYKLATASPREDPEIDSAKGRAALARFASLHDYMMDAKAEVIVEHFRQKSAHKIDGQAKAMVVTRSRLHAVRTKEAIDKYLRRKGYDAGAHPLRALVAFSGTVTDPDAPEVTYTEAMLNGFPETQLPKQFEEEFQVLVVAEKYQTGFDQPLLHTMYVDKKLSGVKAVQTLSRLNRTHPGKDDTFVLDFANTADEIQEAFEPFYEQSLAQPTDPQLLYTMEHELMTAGVLSRDEMDAATVALLSDDPSQQPIIYANLTPAVGRFISLDEDDQEKFRETLTRFIRAYAFVAQIMPWADASLERLFLYSKMLQADLPERPDDPMPQLSRSVQLTHLRLSVTGEGSISLQGTDEPGDALPRDGKGPSTEPILDKLSALIAVMNEKYGADLGESDKIWVDQQWSVVMEDEEMRQVALHNDRAQFGLVLEEKIKELLLSRQDKNEELFSQFFTNADFQTMMLDYLAGTYDELRELVG
ncbi:type I restriction endonuclease subunit R [Brachybacterium paraconglomeratum]|uniref:type I restriction endonuclease subunit R n=1 Tax=Brachybacterium paraconglomeratum TaxID=173362 RepID=UPI00223A6DA9|nr:DEAD/DEAH box helicase family protein [Brachybacterium paraconglomeratum]MCT1435938.1 DEAD/DEAH box helicase family protein [Brachybacterium paraconglomeratum]